MHEAAIALSVIEIAEGVARQRGSTNVRKIKLKIGEFRGVVGEALEFSFQALKKGTFAANADLEVETIRLRVECRNCSGIEVATDDFNLLCPECGLGRLRRFRQPAHRRSGDRAGVRGFRASGSAASTISMRSSLHTSPVTRTLITSLRNMRGEPGFRRTASNTTSRTPWPVWPRMRLPPLRLASCGTAVATGWTARSGAESFCA